MKRKGFTLIELLAVIVVLAIIALITVPLIINVIDKSKKNAFIDSAYGIIEAGRLYYVENTLEKDTLERYDFEVQNKKFVLKEDSTKTLKFTGTMPNNGMLQLHASGNIAIAICNNSYCACKSASELKVAIKDTNCKISSETGEVEDTESVSDAKLKELEESVHTLNQKVVSLENKLVISEKKQVKIGTVISYMGKKVPEGYLACDGKTYNIQEYKDLADQIKEEFGSYHYFGGNGTTTFAVPDLRGEFLRGTGTATRDTGTGSEVGKHQDATLHTPVFSFYDPTSTYMTFTAYYGRGVTDPNFNINIDSRNQDKSYGSSIASLYLTGGNFATSTESEASDHTHYDYRNKPTVYTSRPTNTSVLYAIKYS